MLKMIIIFALLIITGAALVFGLENSPLDEMFNNAFMKIPSAYEVNNNMSSLSKELFTAYSCRIFREDGNFLSRVVSVDSENDEKISKLFPGSMLPEIGDETEFDLEDYIISANPFGNGHLSKVESNDITERDGQKYNLYKIEYSFINSKGRIIDMDAEVLTDYKTGLLRYLTAVPVVLPDKLDNSIAKLTFAGDSNHELKITEFSINLSGKYLFQPFSMDSLTVFSY